MAGNRAGALKAWDKRGRKHVQPGAYVRHRGQPQAPAQQPAPAKALEGRPLGRRPGTDEVGQRALVGVGYKLSDMEKREKDMLSPVKKVKVLGGGVSETYKVKLEGGGKGCFKPRSGERGNLRDGIDVGLQPERELGAWEVAKLVGMEDMVGPVQIREFDVPGRQNGWPKYPPGVKEGSLAEWQEGEMARDVHPSIAFDGNEDFQRATMFDYIIANQDRHAKNWVVETIPPSGGRPGTVKMRLIDHGLAFGTGDFANDRHNGNTMFLDRAAGDPRFAGLSPAKFAEPYVKNKDKILKSLLRIGLPAEAVRQVGVRIDRAAQATTWGDLFRNASPGVTSMSAVRSMFGFGFSARL